MVACVPNSVPLPMVIDSKTAKEGQLPLKCHKIKRLNRSLIDS